MEKKKIKSLQTGNLVMPPSGHKVDNSHFCLADERLTCPVNIDWVRITATDGNKTIPLNHIIKESILNWN